MRPMSIRLLHPVSIPGTFPCAYSIPRCAMRTRDPRGPGRGEMRGTPWKTRLWARPCASMRGQSQRRGWDSNPRTACTVNGFQDRPDQPLRHPSGSAPPGLGPHGVLLSDLVEDLVGDVDRHIDGHGQGDRVAGPRVDLDELAVVADPQLGEISMLAQLIDVNILQVAAQQVDGG